MTPRGLIAAILVLASFGGGIAQALAGGGNEAEEADPFTPSAQVAAQEMAAEEAQELPSSRLHWG